MCSLWCLYSGLARRSARAQALLLWPERHESAMKGEATRSNSVVDEVGLASENAFTPDIFSAANGSRFRGLTQPGNKQITRAGWR